MLMARRISRFARTTARYVLRKKTKWDCWLESP